jgi:hypothetical protein
MDRTSLLMCHRKFPFDKGFHWLRSADWLAALAIRPTSTIGRSALSRLGIPPYGRQPDRSDRDIGRDSLTSRWWRRGPTRWVTTCGRGAGSFVPATSGLCPARDAASRGCLSSTLSPTVLDLAVDGENVWAPRRHVRDIDSGARDYPAVGRRQRGRGLWRRCSMSLISALHSCAGAQARSTRVKPRGCITAAMSSVTRPVSPEPRCRHQPAPD